MKDFLRLGLILIPICAAIWFLAPDGQAPTIIAGLIVLVLLSVATTQPLLRAYVLAHPKQIRIGGVLSIVGGAFLFGAPVFWPGAAPDEGMSMTMSLCAVIAGFALLVMPQSAKRTEDLKVLRERGGGTPFDPKESGPAEALKALRFVSDHPWALARIVLPWGLIGIGTLVASVYLGTELLKTHSSQGAGAAVLMMLGVSVLVMFVSYPMSALAWARFVAGHPASPFSPLRASGAYLWRFLVIAMAAHTFSEQFSPVTAYLTDRLSLSDPESLDGLMSLGAYLVILLIFGPMALVLPAIAVGDRRRATGLVTDFFQPGRRYVLGLILAAAPFVATNFIAEIASAYLQPSNGLSPWLLLGVVPLLATFLGIATVMTYLMQIYRKVSAETDVGPYTPFVADTPE